MKMITFRQRGSFDRSQKWLSILKRLKQDEIIKRYAEEGISALESATPKDTGVTAGSWKYEVVRTTKGFNLYWTNDNLTETGIPIVILLQYGHGTGTGSFVEGKDFINPAIKPIFERISENLWKEVSAL